MNVEIWRRCLLLRLLFPLLLLGFTAVVKTSVHFRHLLGWRKKFISESLFFCYTNVFLLNSYSLNSYVKNIIYKPEIFRKEPFHKM